MKTSKKSAEIPTLAELKSLCAEWQKRLRLQDWRVRIRYSKEYELDGSQANVNARIHFKAATILINPFVDGDAGPDDCLMPLEVRVIHELVHLHMEAFWPKCEKGSLQWDLAESAVDSLSWALYRAKHGDKARDAFVDS